MNRDRVERGLQLERVSLAAPIQKLSPFVTYFPISVPGLYFRPNRSFPIQCQRHRACGAIVVRHFEVRNRILTCCFKSHSARIADRDRNTCNALRYRHDRNNVFGPVGGRNRTPLTPNCSWEPSVSPSGMERRSRNSPGCC